MQLCQQFQLTSLLVSSSDLLLTHCLSNSTKISRLHFCQKFPPFSSTTAYLASKSRRKHWSALCKIYKLFSDWKSNIDTNPTKTARAGRGNCLHQVVQVTIFQRFIKRRKDLQNWSTDRGKCSSKDTPILAKDHYLKSPVLFCWAKVLFRDGPDSVWGFRLKGGSDVDGGSPLEVVRVGSDVK